MATPSKNLQDPTGISNYRDTRPVKLPPIHDAAKIRALGQMALMPWDRITKWALAIPGLLSPRPMPQVPVKVPVPPMGRQMILTFPPIYRERGVAAIVTGQLYPPRAQ
jgi:hypothetical protein